MSIETYIDTVEEKLKVTLAGVCDDVEQHPGRFTQEELKRISTANRAVRIAVEDILRVIVNGLRVQSYHLQLSAVVICGDQDGPDRNKSALEIVAKVCSVLPRQSWNNPALYGIVVEGSVAATNLYNGDIDGQGLAMWGVTWQQIIKQET